MHSLPQSTVRRYLRSVVCLLLGVVAIVPAARAEQSIELARADTRRIVEILANDIEKKFYDPSLKGVDVKRLADETKQQINSLSDVGQMQTAVWNFVLKLDDSHTRYAPPRLTQSPNFGFRAQGVADKVLVVAMSKNGPAEKAGVKLGDRILALNGQRVTRDNISDVVFFFTRLRPVRLLVMDYVRDGVQSRLAITPALRIEPAERRIDDISDFYRDVVELENEYHESPFMYGSVGDVGYVKLTSFSGGLPEVVMWKIKDANSVIVDLRGNPGGNTEVLRQMTGFFDRQNTPIADMVGRKKTEKLLSKPQRVYFDGPLVILVDAGSGSASEIFAYHMQRIGRAVVIGDKTMGAVSAADFIEEHVGAYTVTQFGLLLTTAKVVFPDGKSIEKLGVTPDIMCVPTEDDLATGKDPCLSRAALIAKEKLAKRNPTTTQAAGK
jgi:carboxyl-terminal processing protease